MMYAIYDQSTGQIVRNVQTDDVAAQMQVGESYIDGAVDDSLFYIENGLPVAIPAKPDQFAMFDFATKQWVLDSALAINDATLKRQQMLYASDWTQIPNGPLTPAQQTSWATYRQELRDITKQQGYPFSIVWPVAP